MSGGQYDLERRKNASDQRSQSGLELDIVDHINTTRRSVNTLSGGEEMCIRDRPNGPTWQSVTPVLWPPCERPIPLIKGKCPEGTKGIGLAVSEAD